MRDIKFRQPIFDKGKFYKWHYWGFIGGDQFVGVISPISDAMKTSQQYTGLKDSQNIEEYYGDITIANFDGEWDLFIIEDGNSAVLYRSPVTDNVFYFWELPVHYVIGNIYENPELFGEVEAIVDATVTD